MTRIAENEHVSERKEDERPDTGLHHIGRTYADVQRSSEFLELRHRFRRFVFPMTALFLVWYFVYVLLAAFAPGFMGTSVVGHVNLGLLFGLGQFVSTFAITMIYVRWADRVFDPTASRLRAHLEEAS